MNNNLKEWSENIKNNLTIEQVKDLLYSLGADPIIKGNLITARTICHNGESHKLYYYDNTKLFRCFTECSSIFDIYELIIKIKKINGEEINLFQAINYIISFFNLSFSSNSFLQKEKELNEWSILNKYEENNLLEEQKKIIDYKFYNEEILKNLPQPKIPMWLKEGMTQEVLNYAEIAFDPVNWGIVIPHRDPAGHLIGIRERTLIKEEEQNGKYKPAILNYQMYNHALGYNLYNLNHSKNNIKVIKKAIIFEGEKSTLLYASYFGIDNDISVAVCGSSLTTYQIQLLKSLDVEEIIIAFDKQFKELGDDEWRGWTKKLKDIHKKYHSLVNISFIFDKWDFLDYKDSPIDKGKDIFLELFKRRVSL